MLQGCDAPTMPGNAPTVLVMPRRKGACRGDKSAWLQYRPHMEKEAIPSAAVTRAAEASRRQKLSSIQPSTMLPSIILQKTEQMLEN